MRAPTMISVRRVAKDTRSCNGCGAEATVQLMTCVMHADRELDEPIAVAVDFCDRCAETVTKRLQRSVGLRRKVGR